MGSGVRNLMKFGKAFGGREPELVEGDIFKITIGVPDSGLKIPANRNLREEVTGEVTGEATGEVTGEVKRIVIIIRGEMKRIEIQRAMSFKSADHFRKAYLEPALSSGLIEMTKPESPNSPVQKYRLTQQGEALRKLLLSRDNIQ